MKKFLLEAGAVLTVLIVAGVIILLLFTQNIEGPAYDVFTGNVNKAPVNVTSPVYGQIMTLPVQEGDAIKKGQVLATIHILNPDTIPVTSPLYAVNTDTMMLTVYSPTSGIAGQVFFAPLSTIAGAGALLQIYAPTSLEVQILIPQNDNIHDYASFYASHSPDKRRYQLHVLGQIPTNVISNIDPTMSVYQATCVQSCQSLINDEAVAIYAQRPQAHSPIHSPIIDWIQHFAQGILKKI